MLIAAFFVALAIAYLTVNVLDWDESYIPFLVVAAFFLGGIAGESFGTGIASAVGYAVGWRLFRS